MASDGSIQLAQHDRSRSDRSMPCEKPISSGAGRLVSKSENETACETPFIGDGFLADISKNNFDIIRLFLAYLVILSHSYPLLNRYKEEPLAILSGNQSTLGELAVTAFFMISGYLITRSWNGSRSFQSYMLKRVCRIYPGFFVASLVCLLIVGPLGSSDRLSYIGQIRPLHFVAKLALLQPPFPATFQTLTIDQVNGSLWSIPWEFYCYLSIPVVAYLGCLRKRRWFLALFSISMLLLAVKTLYAPRLPFPGKIVTSFMAGQVFFLYADRIKFNRSLAILCIPPILFACVQSHLHLYHIFLPVFGSYLLFYLAFAPSRMLSLAKSMTGGNDISYGVYLYGWPVQQMIIAAFPGSIHPLMLFVLATLGTTILGSMSWFLVERRFLARKTRHKPVELQMAWSG